MRVSNDRSWYTVNVLGFYVYLQGCRKLLKVGGPNGAAKWGGGQVGGGQLGVKSCIFQTELGLIPVTRCDQCYAFSTRYSTFGGGGK